MLVGVVGVQGDVAEHVAAVERAGDRRGLDVEGVAIRNTGVVPDCDALALPGGESTTISRLLDRRGIAAEVVAHVETGKPLFATCAGLIVVARDARDERVDTLGLLDVAVDRNAFGRQRDSFEASVDVVGLDEPFPAVFIRAPAVAEVGAAVEVLATVDGRPVAVREGPVVGTAFHPELTDDFRLHDLALLDPLAETA
jgi:5'-phosphate synthase pdxT subunit